MPALSPKELGKAIRGFCTGKAESAIKEEW